ncbi:MAG: hypothetical protein AB2417_20085 [Clostridiaceae bacterium]
MIWTGLVAVINLILKALSSVAGLVVLLLPTSPFKVLEGLNLPYIDTLNWVLPISFCVSVLTYWVGAIAIYYVVQVVLRWVKVIE